MPNIDPTKIKMPLGIVVAGGGAATNWPAGWTNMANTAPGGIGISISEPLFSSPNYYPEPTVKGADNVTQWYGDPQMINSDPTTGGGYFRNTPLDKDPNRPLGGEGNPTQAPP